MTIENQVTSLEPSKQLRELGVRQESLFWWATFRNESSPKEQWGNVYSEIIPEDQLEDLQERRYLKDLSVCSAFTASELGELLPVEFHNDDLEKFSMRIWKDYDGQWFVVYFNSKGGYEFIEFGTLADAMAKMLIHLLENKLMTLPNM